MTEQDKKLLLKDLSARLPYGVICHSNIGDGYLRVCSVDRIAFGIEYRITLSTIEKYSFNDDEQDDAVVKPYLRPMSSMTEKEKKKIQALYHENTQNVFKDPDEVRGYKFYDISVVDWLNENHFDYRGLISMGLALVAPEDMYKTE